MKNAAFTLVMLPPHDEVRRGWATRVAQEPVGVRVLQPETVEQAIRDIAEAEAAFGTIPPEVLRAHPQVALAAGAAGRSAGRVLLSRAGRAPGGGHQLPRDLQRSYRRAHHGLRAGLRARLPHLSAAADAARVSRQAARHRRGASARGHRADPGRGRHRQRGRAAVQGVRHACDRRRCAAQRQAGGGR